MGLPAPDQVNEVDLSKPVAGEEVSEAKDGIDMVESELMNEVLPKEELPAFMATLNGTGLDDTVTKVLSPFEAVRCLDAGLATASPVTKPS